MKTQTSNKTMTNTPIPDKKEGFFVQMSCNDKETYIKMIQDFCELGREMFQSQLVVGLSICPPVRQGKST